MTLWKHLEVLVYIGFKRLSRKKCTQPQKVSYVAKRLGISQQAVSSWLNGKMSSPKLARYIRAVYGPMLPARLDKPNQSVARRFFAITKRADKIYSGK